MKLRVLSFQRIARWPNLEVACLVHFIDAIHFVAHSLSRQRKSRGCVFGSFHWCHPFCYAQSVTPEKIQRLRVWFISLMPSILLRTVYHAREWAGECSCCRAGHASLGAHQRELCAGPEPSGVQGGRDSCLHSHTSTLTHTCIQNQTHTHMTAVSQNVKTLCLSWCTLLRL